MAVELMTLEVMIVRMRASVGVTGCTIVFIGVIALRLWLCRS